MKLSLRNFAMGTALVTSSLAFAQEAPFTVTETFNRFVTAADYVPGATSFADMRSGCAYGGKVYNTNKATGEIYVTDAEGIRVYANVDVKFGDNNKTLGTAITVDDAGNIVVAYGTGLWYGDIAAVAIIPAANPAEPVYVDLTFPADWTAGRVDAFGRIVGDVMSADGAYFYLTGSKAGQTVACYWVQEGVFTPEEYTSNPYASAGSALNIAFPMFNTFAEQSDLETLSDGAYLLNWGGTGPEWTASGKNGCAGRPAVEGVAYAAVPGGDTFVHEGKRYFVYNYTSIPGKRTGCVMIYDEDLNMVWNYANPNAETIAAGSFLNGGGLFVQQTGEHTFNLGFYTGAYNGVTCASYVIEFPSAVTPAEPGKLYLVGAPSGWKAPSAENADWYANYALNETEAGSGIYTGSFDVAMGQGMFRFYSALEGWEANSYGIQEADVAVDVTFTDNVYNGAVVAGKGSYNFTKWFGGKMDFTVNLTAGTVTINATPAFTAPALLVRGAFNNWGTDVAMTAPAAPNADGLYEYTATLPALTGEFKLANADWTINYGAGEPAPALESGVAYDAWFNSSNNFNLAADGRDVKITLLLCPDNAQASKLTLEYTAFVPSTEAVRNNYVYDLKVVENNQGVYTLSYKATGAGKATLVLNAAGKEEIQASLGDAVKGENTVTFDGQDLEKGVEYSFGISITNEANNAALTPAVVYTAPKFALQTRGGVVVINDTESDAFGMVTVCAGKAQGFQVFNQDLDLLGTYHAGNAAFAATNQSSPFRGAPREGKAVFGDWADAGSNYWVIDPLNPEELGRMFDAPATKASSGLWTLDGVEIGGGNSGHCFVGKGAETKMYTMIEDMTEYKKKIGQYDLGSASLIEVAPVKCFSNATAMLPNLNLQFAPAETGMFITQIRANVAEAGVCRLLFVDYNDEVLASWWNDVLPNAAGGVALTVDGSILAVATQSNIMFFDVTWGTDGVPALAHIEGWDVPMQSDFTELAFDQANNLYAYVRGLTNLETKGMVSIALPQSQAIFTPAKSSAVIKGAGSGVEGVAADAAAEAVYYTVGGVRVATNALTPGIYVKVVGNKATKVVVK